MTNDHPARLSTDAVSAALAGLEGWRLDSERLAIRKHYRFTDFVEAFAFMTRVALLAERAGHHPEWSNVYDRVEIALTTHDADGISSRDIALAKEIDQTR